MNIAICDDDLYIHDNIRLFIKNNYIEQDQISFVDFNSGEELLKYFNKGEKIDILFLDIEMEQTSGIEAAEKIREINKDIIIIFVSSHREYVFNTFKVEPLHFIVKLISEIELNDVFTRAVKKYNLIHSYIKLKWSTEIYQIKIDDIIYIEGYHRHLIVHTTKEKIESVGKTNDIFNSLQSHGFVRVHQGYIVNMSYIKKIDKNDIILNNDEKIMMSARKRADTLKAFSNYIEKWKW